MERHIPHYPADPRPLIREIATRARIHAAKMQDEGWYVTANVLDEAANEIERLCVDLAIARGEIVTPTQPPVSDDRN